MYPQEYSCFSVLTEIKTLKQEYSCFSVLTEIKTKRPAEIFKTRGIYNEEVVGNVPGAGHGAGTVQRELGGGI